MKRVYLNCRLVPTSVLSLSESTARQNRPMQTLLEYPEMPHEKRELMTEEKPLSRYIKDEMTRKEKLLGEILDQTKLVKKRLDKYEKQIEMDNKEPALGRKDIAEIKEGLAFKQR